MTYTEFLDKIYSSFDKVLNTELTDNIFHSIALLLPLAVFLIILWVLLGPLLFKS